MDHDPGASETSRQSACLPDPDPSVSSLMHNYLVQDNTHAHGRGRVRKTRERLTGGRKSLELAKTPVYLGNRGMSSQGNHILLDVIQYHLHRIPYTLIPLYLTMTWFPLLFALGACLGEFCQCRVIAVASLIGRPVHQW